MIDKHTRFDQQDYFIIKLFQWVLIVSSTLWGLKLYTYSKKKKRSVEQLWDGHTHENKPEEESAACRVAWQEAKWDK